MKLNTRFVNLAARRGKVLCGNITCVGVKPSVFSRLEICSSKKGNVVKLNRKVLVNKYN